MFEKKQHRIFSTEDTSIAPLLTFRVLFGALMFLGTLRFMANGWIEKLYLTPNFFFKFYGFEWISPLDKTGIYILFSLILLSSLFILFGFIYRIACLTFFLSFTYVELIDASNYLNHHYLVCLLAFLLIFIPAHRDFSIDSWLNPKIKTSVVPKWTIHLLMGQIALVYFFAGLAKLNYDWLFLAMPLANWLPQHTDLPIIGFLFGFKATPFVFSWLGAFYDLTIVFFLLNKRTRPFAYLAVIGFHTLTGMLFNIGLFPMIMIFSTLIFFSAETHKKGLHWVGYRSKEAINFISKKTNLGFLKIGIGLYFIIQISLPLRHFFYDGNVLWNEAGYRFSWRVMLVEKIGQITFFVEENDRKVEVQNSKYLTKFQEKQMAIQPDFILQFAHFLEKEYKEKHAFSNPSIRVSSHVALNGRISQTYINPRLDLAKTSASFSEKKWINSFKH